MKHAKLHPDVRAELVQVMDLIRYLDDNSPDWIAYDASMGRVDELLQESCQTTDPARRERLQQEIQAAGEKVNSHKPTRLDRAIDAHVRALHAEADFLRAVTPASRKRAKKELASATQALAKHPSLERVLDTIERRKKRLERAMQAGDGA